MARLIDVVNQGILKLPTTENTSSVGNVWFNTVTQRTKYSWCGSIWSTGGSLIQSRTK